MENQQDTQSTQPDSEGYLVSAGLLIGALLTQGTLRFALLTGAVLAFGFTHRIDGDLLAIRVFQRTKTLLSPAKRRSVLLVLEFAIPKFTRILHHFEARRASLKREDTADQLVSDFLTLAEDDLNMAASPRRSATLSRRTSWTPTKNCR